MRNLAIVLVLVLAGCAGSAETRATNALAAACDGYATALDQLVPFKADLTDSQIGRVDAANTIAAVPCSSGSTIDPAEGVGAVKAAINLINAVFGEAS